MFLKILGVINLLALALMGCATPASGDVKAAQAAVTTAWQANQHLVWEIEWPAAPIAGSLTVETWRVGRRYRFEILEATAPNLIGQTLILDGQTAWRYNRFDSEPRPSASSALLSPVTDAFAIITKLTAAVPESATQETVQLAHSPMQKITLFFNNGDRLTLWQDTVTGLPTRIIFKLSQQQATLRARSFEPLLDPPDGLFKPSW